MTMHDDFHRDLIDLAVERYRKGYLDRRSLLAGLAALGAVPVFGRGRTARADVKEIVLANWGGDAARFFAEAWGEPFTADTGIDVVIDGSGPSGGRMMAMVDANAVTWDTCDSNGHTAIRLGRQGYFAPVDWNVVKRERILPQLHTSEWGVPNYTYAFVIAFDRSRFPDGPPETWEDFFNVRDFPGRRTLRKSVDAHIELALMGDGLPMEEVYPLDDDKIERAFAKLREFRDNVIFWGTGAESQQLLRSGEVTCGCTWHTRVTVLRSETDGRIDWTWNQAILSAGAWVTPRGNPAGDAVWDFLASMQEPDRQVHLLNLFGNGPCNPEADALVPAEMQPFNPSNPENTARMLPIDDFWYADNDDAVRTRYLDLTAGL
jgi:putative spermidine/putrescine transport system substrate-binding protein